ncbi:MAG: ribosome silencing factor [Bacilli bacterium]|nr:ribosome silencing factor [Bacilli bacterium]
MIKAATLAKDFLDEHKAEDIKVVDVKDHTPFASYYIIATMPNTRALGAIADLLEDHLEENKIPVRGIDGTPDSGWVIVDAGQVVVHLFIEAKRQEIDLASVVSKRKNK